MATSKSRKVAQKDVNIPSIGRSYYNIVDVFSQKIISSLVEEIENVKSGKISSEDFKVIFANKITTETESFKSWGWDVLSKKLRE